MNGPILASIAFQILDGTHSRAPISCRSPPSSPAPPLPYQPSTISAFCRRLPDLDGTHSRDPHILSFSSHLSRTTFPAPTFRHLHLAIVASQIWMESIPEPPISCHSPPSSPAPPLPHQPSTIFNLDGTHSRCSPPSSPALAFHHLRFPSSPLKSRQNPFPSPPSPIVLRPPLPHQPFTISASPSSPPRSERNPFPSPPSPTIHLPPLPHQPSTIFASCRCLPDLDGTHSQASHLLPFSSLLSRTNLSPSPLAIVDAAGTGHREQETSTEPIALFSSLLSCTILSRSPLAIVDAAGIGDWERKISTEPIALFSSFLSSPAFHHFGLAIVDVAGMGTGNERSGWRESMIAGESQGGVRLSETETEPEPESGVGEGGHIREVF